MTDLDARCFIKRGVGLFAADFAAEEFLAEIKDGREVLVTIRRPRSPAHHRWFFSMLRLVVSNTDYWQTEEELLDALKLATGHVRRIMKLDGEIILLPLSISFAAMGEDAFIRFRKRSVHVLCRALGWDPQALMDETDATQTQRRELASPSIAPAPTRERERERETT